MAIINDYSSSGRDVEKSIAPLGARNTSSALFGIASTQWCTLDQSCSGIYKSCESVVGDWPRDDRDDWIPRVAHIIDPRCRTVFFLSENRAALFSSIQTRAVLRVHPQATAVLSTIRALRDRALCLHRWISMYDIGIFQILRYWIV